MSTQALDIGWIAGIIEGEGHIGFNARSPRIVVNMTDKDVIEKLADRVHGHVLGPYVEKRKDTHKLQYRVAVYGKYAVGLMFTIFPLMGKRRQAKIKEVLSIWKQVPARGLAPKCHPDRKHQAHGLCIACYLKEYNAKKKGVMKGAKRV